MVQKARIELRCSDEDRDAFDAARRRDGDDTISQWLRRIGRMAARTAAALSVTALVKP
jgi:hypothetical protein